MKTIILASGNQGKLIEIQQALNPITVVPQSEYDLKSVAETGATFVENALIKARHASCETNLPAMADDSGLIVPALRDQPGIHSARYAGEHASDQGNLDKLLRMMDGITNRRAFFYCTIVLINHGDDPMPLICEGTLHGEITLQPQGQGGFGYDPIFFLPDKKITTAQLTTMEKNKISHRGKALDMLKNKIHEKLNPKGLTD